jgi:uncharacterized delta-60 repeat protein
MRNTFKKIIFIFLCLGSLNVFAQDGSTDVSFDPGALIDGTAGEVAIQSDGKIIVGGNFNTYNGSPIADLIRLNSDGSLDASFDSDLEGVGEIVIQPDGKILVATETTIVRLNVDGSIDTGFDAGTGGEGNSDVIAIVLQPDGKILIAGEFTEFNGATVNRITRLNSDGSIDSSFDPGAGANKDILTMALQSDGKIMIGGYFESFDGIDRDHIARLNSDGSLDPSFNPTISGYLPWVFKCYIQSDNKILLSGNFTAWNSVSNLWLARLNPDGSVDTGFNSNLNSVTRDMAVQPDGKIVVVGDFALYDTIHRRGIARLNADGTLDTSFDPGPAAYGGYYHMRLAVQSDNKIIITGGFTAFNDESRNKIARVNVTLTGLKKSIEKNNLTIYPNPASQEFTIKNNQPLQISIVNILGETVMNKSIQMETSIDISNLENGMYFIQTMDGTSFKFIKE